MPEMRSIGVAPGDAEFHGTALELGALVGFFALALGPDYCVLGSNWGLVGWKIPTRPWVGQA